MTRFELGLFAGSVVHAPGDTLLLPVPEDERPLQGDAGRIDWRLCGEITHQLLTGFISGASDEAILLTGRAPLQASRLLLLGAGPSDRLDSAGVEALMAAAVQRVDNLHSPSALLALPGAIDLERAALDVLRGVLLGLRSQRRERTFRLVVPDARERAGTLEAAMAALMDEAHRWRMTVEVRWLPSDELPAPAPAHA